MRVLTGQDVRQAISMAEAIPLVRQALMDLSAGRAEVPVRHAIQVAEGPGVALFMPAYWKGGQALGFKNITVFPGNRERGLPTSWAVVLLSDVRTGRPLVLLDGAYLTALRTGAASAVATDALARPGASVLALIGAGAQARTQLLGVCQVRRIREVRVYARHRESALAFAQEMAGVGRVPQSVRAVGSSTEALRGAEIVVTATSSETPVFQARDLEDGVHLNGIGSFTPQMQEVPEEVVTRAKVVVDSREACLAEAGDLIIPMKVGRWRAEQLHAEIGEVLAGRVPGRETDEEITFFKMVGNALLDLAVATRVVEVAQTCGLGVEVEF